MPLVLREILAVRLVVQPPRYSAEGQLSSIASCDGHCAKLESLGAVESGQYNPVMGGDPVLAQVLDGQAGTPDGLDDSLVEQLRGTGEHGNFMKGEAVVTSRHKPTLECRLLLGRRSKTRELWSRTTEERNGVVPLTVAVAVRDFPW